MGVLRLFIFSVLLVVLSLAFASPRERQQRSEAGLLLSRVIRDEEGVVGEPLHDVTLLLLDQNDGGSGYEPTKS